MSNLEFAVGKRVVCINADWSAYFARWEGHRNIALTQFPRHRAVYTIRGFDNRDEPGTVGLLLEEIINPPLLWKDGLFESGFDSARFRPVRETSIDCFTKLLEKQPELVGGDA